MRVDGVEEVALSIGGRRAGGWSGGLARLHVARLMVDRARVFGARGGSVGVMRFGAERVVGVSEEVERAPVGAGRVLLGRVCRWFGRGKCALRAEREERGGRRERAHRPGPALGDALPRVQPRRVSAAPDHGLCAQRTSKRTVGHARNAIR